MASVHIQFTVFMEVREATLMLTAAVAESSHVLLQSEQLCCRLTRSGYWDGAVCVSFSSKPSKSGGASRIGLSSGNVQS